jgi:hypothetical protein
MFKQFKHCVDYKLADNCIELATNKISNNLLLLKLFGALTHNLTNSIFCITYIRPSNKL